MEELLEEVERALRLGIRAFSLFPVIPNEKKDERATEAFQHNNILFQSVRKIHAGEEAPIRS